MKLIVLAFLAFTSALSHSDTFYKNYDADGRLISISSMPLAHQVSPLKDKYVFIHKDHTSPFQEAIFGENNVLKVGGTYIFNEKIHSGFYKNEDYTFEKIITIEEQMKNEKKPVKSVLIDTYSPVENVGNYDNQKPRFTYKPYAVINEYSLINSSKKVIRKISEKSEMQFLTLEECKSAIPQYKKIGNEKIKNHILVESNLLSINLNIFCSKITR